jgi:signal transduction histidine kinase
LGRAITGEKGIGRFAVRFLGTTLNLYSVANDVSKGFRTALTVDFDWRSFDDTKDLGKVPVKFALRRANPNEATGTRLLITQLSAATANIDFDSVRTASVSIVTPHGTLLAEAPPVPLKRGRKPQATDPGFSLNIQPAPKNANDGNLARAVLGSAVLRAVVNVVDGRMSVNVYRRGVESPAIAINDKYANKFGRLYADIRFFPKRKGTFADLPIDGRRASTWVKDNGGVAVFDRQFRVSPYGIPGDDWLSLASDAVRRTREPASRLAQKYFPMDETTKNSTQLNYMLRLPYPQQLVGVVRVEGRRSADRGAEDEGLIAAADREGFVDNEAFAQLKDIVRGAVEAIASADRELQQEQQRAKDEETLKSLRLEARAAIREIQANAHIKADDKQRIVKQIAATQALAEKHEQRTREREATLEVMSLLGVVAGFMTHEFGVALDELERGRRKLTDLGKTDPFFKDRSQAIEEHVTILREFVTYSQGYIQGSASRPTKPYPARPRVQQVIRVFGRYAVDRGITPEVEVDAELHAPLVPVSLYSGILLNLFTNALKAVIAKSNRGERRIAFRAWNEDKHHYLEVSDTGIGIPNALWVRVFDPLFTTTASNRDPLGSGMGLGLALVKRGVESYGGNIHVVEPPAGFATCFRMKMPLVET